MSVPESGWTHIHARMRRRQRELRIAHVLFRILRLREVEPIPIGEYSVAFGYVSKTNDLDAALEQALDRFETAFNAMHPGDYTDDELHGLAQGLWFGAEEIRAALGREP